MANTNLIDKNALLNFIETQRVIETFKGNSDYKVKVIYVDELLEWIKDGYLDYSPLNLKQFGARLKSLRTSTNTKTLLTQNKAAKKIGMSFEIYKRYEQGVRNPKKEYLEKIAEFYGVTMNYLLGLEDYNGTV